MNFNSIKLSNKSKISKIYGFLIEPRKGKGKDSWFFYSFLKIVSNPPEFLRIIGDLSDITSSITAYAILSLLFYVKNPVDLRLS